MVGEERGRGLGGTVGFGGLRGERREERESVLVGAQGEGKKQMLKRRGVGIARRVTLFSHPFSSPALLLSSP